MPLDECSFFFYGKRFNSDSTSTVGSIGLGDGGAIMAISDNDIFKFDPSSCDVSVKLMRLILQYGEGNDHFGFGLWATALNERFCALLDRIAEMDREGSLSTSRDLLNKCLLGRKDDSALPHIKSMLVKLPEVASTTDRGRIPLHHALVKPGCGTSSYEAAKMLVSAYPKGCLIVDPTTGLYPFMLAGLNGNLNSAFELLLAEPSLSQYK